MICLPLRLVCVAVLVPTSAFLSEKSVAKRASSNGASCFKDDVEFFHGEIFVDIERLPCVESRCDNGNFVVAKEGCPVGDYCVPLGSTHEEACMTYDCTKSTSTEVTVYRATISTARCRDHAGNCHEPGSRFTLVSGGDEVYNNCTCTLSDHEVDYRCDDK